MPRGLKYDWYGPLFRLRYEPTRHPYDRIDRVLSVAERFVDKWADWAELAGMRPAHLLRNDPDDFGGRGLAWRCEFGGIDVLCFPKPGYVCLTGREFTFVNAFEPSGAVRMVTGAEWRAILATPFRPYCAV